MNRTENNQQNRTCVKCFRVAYIGLGQMLWQTQNDNFIAHGLCAIVLVVVDVLAAKKKMFSFFNFVLSFIAVDINIPRVAVIARIRWVSTISMVMSIVIAIIASSTILPMRPENENGFNQVLQPMFWRRIALPVVSVLLIEIAIDATGTYTAATMLLTWRTTISSTSFAAPVTVWVECFHFARVCVCAYVCDFFCFLFDRYNVRTRAKTDTTSNNQSKK